MPEVVWTTGVPVTPTVDRVARVVTGTDADGWEVMEEVSVRWEAEVLRVENEC